MRHLGPPDAERADGEAYLPQKQDQSDDEQQHRDDEQPGNLPAEGGVGEIGDEQHRDQDADEQGRGRAGGDGEIDHRYPSVEDAQLRHHTLACRIVERAEVSFEGALALDGASETLRHDVQEGADAGEQENRRDRHLNLLRNGGDGAFARNPGDPTQLARQVDAAPLSYVARDYGQQFANALSTQPRGLWQGPVHSAFGLHIVFVSEFIPARMPALAEVREAAERDWSRDRRTAAIDAWYRQLRQRYTVSIEPRRGTP